ncbi:MAG: NUDIX domain-containing protein [Candidatus Roizmanbacteria bacterium]|nr:NUDIX domain-containing protein [Candidatus Roizmanbacteria bacterium]
MKYEISAGGIVYRQSENNRLWLLIQQANTGHWGFPKGLVGDNNPEETLEEAAAREVQEEGGVYAQIKSKILTPSRYYYTWRGEKVQKTVWYFVMEYESGSVDDHDIEVEDAQFIEESLVPARLTYQNDKEQFGLSLKTLL